MAHVGALIIFQGVLLPNNVPVADHLEELSQKNIQRLGRITYRHEEEAIKRYIKMHGEYMEGSRKPSDMSAQKFASKSFVRKFAFDFAAADLEEGAAKDLHVKTMTLDSSEAILHFLFTFYLSHYEGELSQKRKIKLVSFATWFDRERKKAKKGYMAKLKRREEHYEALDGREREAYVALLRQGKNTWKQNWKDRGYARRMVDFRAAKHVVLMADFEAQDWWRVFKIPTATINAAIDGSAVRTDVLRKYRIWSRFMHTDNINNRALGGPFTDRLAKRFGDLMDKVEKMEKWYRRLDVVVID